MPTPGEPVHHRAQQGVLHGEETVLLLSELVDHVLRFAPEHQLNTGAQLLRVLFCVIKEWIMCTQTDGQTYFVACRFEGSRGDQGVVGFHGDFTRIPSDVGLFKCSPNFFTVVPER